MTDEHPAASDPGHPRVLLIDDHVMFRERLAHLIEEEFEMSVCGQTDNITDAMKLIESTKPDLAIVDITLKGSSGLELLKNLKAQNVKTPTLVLSMHEESRFAPRALAAGARGYITKHENSGTLLRAIQRILDGKFYLSDQMMEAQLQNMSGRVVNESALNRLADRELEVFQLIGRGRSTREISEMLNLGMTTVETYRTRIKQKLSFATGAELVRSAYRWVLEGA
jgi:DNA-binding NarL/FixJ family response regulator